MERLWTRMAACYGASRWEREYGAEWSQAWLQALGAFTLPDLLRGIERSERQMSGRLPTLGEFTGWCRETQPGTYAGASSSEGFQTVSQLLAHKGATDVARKHLDMMRCIASGEGITRAEFEALPPLRMPWGAERPREKAIQKEDG